MKTRCLFAAVLLLLCLMAIFVSAATASSYQEWQFTTNANPAQPTVATNTAGTATATVNVGYSGGGWIESLSSFGSQTGLWDLGLQNTDTTNDTRGQVVLSVPNPVAGSSGTNTPTDLSLRIVQFVDGGFYKGDLTFSIPGVSNGGRTVVETLPGPLPGQWVEDKFQWHLASSPNLISLVITGAVGGTLLDRIRVDTVSAGAGGAGPIITSAIKSSQGLAISWSGGNPPYQVYVTTNLLDSASWRPVGSPVSGTNADVPLSGPINFVKVGGSN
jgi:hypothetical protein